MFLYPSPQEGLAWLQGSDEAWADYAVSLYVDAVKRGSETPADDGT